MEESGVTEQVATFRVLPSISFVSLTHFAFGQVIGGGVGDGVFGHHRPTGSAIIQRGFESRHPGRGIHEGVGALVIHRDGNGLKVGIGFVFALVAGHAARTTTGNRKNNTKKPSFFIELLKDYSSIGGFTLYCQENVMALRNPDSR